MFILFQHKISLQEKKKRLALLALGHNETVHVPQPLTPHRDCLVTVEHKHGKTLQVIIFHKN